MSARAEHAVARDRSPFQAVGDGAEPPIPPLSLATLPPLARSPPSQVKQTHAISTETLLSYIGTRLVSEAPSVALSMDAPAKMAWKTSLT